MRRQNQQPFAVRIEKRHHGFLVGSIGIPAAALGATFIAIGEGGLVAVVSIGDDQFLRRHFADDAGNYGRVEERPEAMKHAVFVARLDRRDGTGRGGEQGVDAALGIGVQHEELAGVRARVAKQLEAIDLGTRQRLLVAEDDAGGVVFDAAQGDEAAAGAALGAARHGVFLRINVDAGCGIAKQDAVANPRGQCLLGARIDVVGGRIGWGGLSLFNGDQIVGAVLEVALLHRGSDLVVGLGNDVGQRTRSRL